MSQTDSIPARLAALKTTPTPELKKQWGDLFDSEPPAFNRRYLESRLAYRIQELAYGGLKPETIKRLERLGEARLRRPREERASGPTIATSPSSARASYASGRVSSTSRPSSPTGGRGVAISDRPRDHRHAVEWPRLLRPQEPAALGMTKATTIKRRCAVYTRKSSEEGLEQEFNSLHAQRESCEAYVVASQKSEGWVLLRGHYDDGGFSGGTLERPGLKALIADIEDGLVDVVVVYKIDRLSRSLADFAKLVEVFDRNNVTFVSVPQSFNTITSMGRVTLNILLSFAQFEREVTAERIRDKFATSREKGMWMGGWAPLGYDVNDRKLVVNAAEAKTVRMIFERFVEIGSATVLAKALRAESVSTKRGSPIDKGFIYKTLNNRIYLGEAVHKGVCHPGEHKPIVDQALWDKVHEVLSASPRRRASNTRAQTPALLRGLLFGPDGSAFSPTHTRRGPKLYRYYVSQSVLKRGTDACPIGRVSAGEIERAVIDQLRAVFRQPEIIVGTWREARKQDEDVTEAEVSEALNALDPLWDELFPAEQARLVQLLVERVEIEVDGLSVRLRIDGLSGVAHEMAAREALAA